MKGLLIIKDSISIEDIRETDKVLVTDAQGHSQVVQHRDSYWEYLKGDKKYYQTKVENALYSIPGWKSCELIRNGMVLKISESLNSDEVCLDRLDPSKHILVIETSRYGPYTLYPRVNHWEEQDGKPWINNFWDNDGIIVTAVFDPTQ